MKKRHEEFKWYKRIEAQQQERREHDRELEQNREEELRMVKAMLQTKDVELHKLSFDKIGFIEVSSMKWDVETEAVKKNDLIYSRYTNIGGAPFRIGCRNEGPHHNLVATLFCNDNGEIRSKFSIKTDITLTLTSAHGPQSSSFCKVFTPADTPHGWIAISWKELLKHKNGFIENGHFTIEASIKVVCCYKDIATGYFSRDLDNVLLLVEGHEIPCNRDRLARFSRFIKALPNREIPEGSDLAKLPPEKIELKGVTHDDLASFISFINQYSHEVSERDVMGVLRAATFLDSDLGRLKCVEFISKLEFISKNMTLSAKLLISEQYTLPELQYEVLRGMENRNVYGRIINSEEFASYSELLQTFLLQKYVDLPH